MRFILIFLVFLVFTLPFVVEAQSDFRPGYVITVHNDTLHGLIDYRGVNWNARKCEFKEGESSFAKEFLPSDIKGFRFKDAKYYVSKEVNINGLNTKLFLEFLVDGIADLYFYIDEENKPYYFLEKADGNLYELLKEEEIVKKDGKTYIHEKNNYIGVLRYAFADCPKIFPLINESPFGTKSLIKITKKYHDYVCDNEKCIIYEKDLKSFKVRFAPYVSFNGSSLTFNSSPYFEIMKFEFVSYPSIGMLMTLPSINEKVLLQFSGEIARTSYNGSGGTFSGGIPNELHFNNISLKNKFGIKYVYPKGKIRPTALLGGNIITSLKEDEKNILYQNFHTNILPKLHVGYNIDVGFNYNHSSSLVSFFGMGYNFSQGVNKNNELLPFYDQIGLKTGLRTILTTFSLNAGLYF